MRPNCLDANWSPVTIPFPDICESEGRVVQAFVTELYVREDFRVKEEGVGVEPEP